MTTMTPSTALVTVQPVFSESERLALAGFLAGYRGLTREAYTLDLRQFTGWCNAFQALADEDTKADLVNQALNAVASQVAQWASQDVPPAGTVQHGSGSMQL